MKYIVREASSKQLPCNLNYKVFFFFFHFQFVKLYHASEITGPNYLRPPLEFHNMSIFPAPSQVSHSEAQQLVLPWRPGKGEACPASHCAQKQTMDLKLTLLDSRPPAFVWPSFQVDILPAEPPAPA